MKWSLTILKWFLLIDCITVVAWSIVGNWDRVSGWLACAIITWAFYSYMKKVESKQKFENRKSNDLKINKNLCFQKMFRESQELFSDFEENKQ